MANWVVDEGIFYIYTDIYDGRCSDAIHLTEIIYRFHKLTLDHEDILMSKYRRIMKNSKLLQNWFVKMNRKIGHIEYRSSKLNQKVDLELDQLKFDVDDKPFVGTSLNSDCLIITDDSDYYEKSVYQYFINDLGLEIFSIEKALNEETQKRYN